MHKWLVVLISPLGYIIIVNGLLCISIHRYFSRFFVVVFLSYITVAFDWFLFYVTPQWRLVLGRRIAQKEWRLKWIVMHDAQRACDRLKREKKKKTTKIEMNGTNHLKWAIKLLFLRGIFICWMDQMVCLFSLLMSPCICVCTCRGRRRWQRPRTALWENEACKMRSSSVTWMKRSYGTDDDVGPQHNESTIYWAGERWMHDWDRTVQRLSHCDGINPLLVWIFSFRNGHIRASLDRFV